ncbi:MAG: hypothetical protein Q6L60_08540 [Thermostichus sp. HHBFW_bins_43]
MGFNGLPPCDSSLNYASKAESTQTLAAVYLGQPSTQDRWAVWVRMLGDTVYTLKESPPPGLLEEDVNLPLRILGRRGF